MISCLKDRIKEISETEKKIADETLKIIEKIIDYNKMLQNIFSLHQKLVKKKKSEPKTEEICREDKIKK